MRKNESAENYLETIYILSKKLPVVRSVDIATELNFKKPSVSVAMKHLREKELIQMQLDIPFTLKFKNELKKQGVNVETNLKMEGMVDALCQLNLNK